MKDSSNSVYVPRLFSMILLEINFKLIVDFLIIILLYNILALKGPSSCIFKYNYMHLSGRHLHIYMIEAGNTVLPLVVY